MGSASTRRGASPVSARTAFACSRPATTQVRSESAKERARASVAASKLLPPITFRNGFGAAWRQPGENRSPGNQEARSEQLRDLGDVERHEAQRQLATRWSKREPEACDDQQRAEHATSALSGWRPC